MRIVINLGAGENWLTRGKLTDYHSTLADVTIFNTGLYEFSSLSMYRKEGFKAEELPYLPNVEFGDATKSGSVDFADNTADVVLAVSPYGYAAINPVTIRLLKVYGYFVVAGNSRNRFATADDYLISVDARAAIDANFEELRQPFGDCSRYGDRWVTKLIQFIFRYYVSKTTHGERTTELNHLRVFRRLG